MSESFRSRLFRWGFNVFPATRRTGGKVTYLAGDLREVRIKLPLNWKTKNYVGTIFGGSMFGCVDPYHMVMLINLLGDDYIVWDKSGRIRFRRPGRSTLFATIRFDDEELDLIRTELQQVEKVDRTYSVDLADSDGMVCATVEKTVQIRKKQR